MPFPFPPRLAAFAALCAAFGHLGAIDVPDYTVQLTAKGSRVPPTIYLTWTPDPDATGYFLSRRLPGSESWLAVASLPGTAARYVDPQVVVGQAYEYRIVKNAREGAVFYTGFGLIQAGIEVRLAESRGKVILLVEESVAAGLAPELARLAQDLVGDGWTVVRHEVNRAAQVTEIKAIIKADYDADPTQVQAVFLFGHVPVPYSGDTYPDGHTEHRGAWPADLFYGDMDGTYTDTTVNRATAARTQNQNVPGDGKYDQTLIPTVNGRARVELQVGRVDLFDLPSFGESEVELLRRYLEKNHAYRHKVTTAKLRGLIDDRFGPFVGEAVGVDSWRNFAPLMGRQNAVPGQWAAAMLAGSWQWAYGCGPGSYVAIPNLVSTGDFAARSAPAVFVLLFGSYFGDWDSSDNLLRAPLAATGSALASAWAGRPHWHFYPMALGQTIGTCARLTQSENLLDALNIGVNEMHVALMGDPTLRLQGPCPPRNVRLQKTTSANSLVRWDAAREPVAGYHIYAAPAAAGPFSRVTTQPLKGLVWDARNRLRGETYMVRSVKLLLTHSGTYFDQSQGVTAAALP